VRGKRLNLAFARQHIGGSPEAERSLREKGGAESTSHRP